MSLCALLLTATLLLSVSGASAGYKTVGSFLNGSGNPLPSMTVQPGQTYGVDFGLKLASGSNTFNAYNVKFAALPHIEFLNWNNYLGGTKYNLGGGFWSVHNMSARAIGSSSYVSLGLLSFRHKGTTNQPVPLGWDNYFTSVSIVSPPQGAPAQTGTPLVVTTGPGWTPSGTGVSVASPEGDSGSVGGIDFVFDNVTTGGQITAEHQVHFDPGLYPESLAAWDFALSSNPAEMWDIEFAGDFTGSVTLTFHYDDTWLTVPEEDLAILHQTAPGAWEALPTISHDVDDNLITVETDSFSPFVLGTEVPEPATMSLLAFGGLALIRRRRK